MKKILFIVLISLFSLVGCSSKPKDKINTQKIITHVTLTVYQPVSSQCNGDPLHTADMSKISLNKLKNKEIKWCAISRDLLWLFKMGDVIEIEGHGLYEIHDLMNKRYDHCIDILIHPSDKTRFRKTNIKVIKYAEI